MSDSPGFLTAFKTENVAKFEFGDMTNQISIGNKMLGKKHVSVENSQATERDEEHPVITIRKDENTKRNYPKKDKKGNKKEAVIDTVNTDNLTESCLQGWVWR